MSQYNVNPGPGAELSMEGFEPDRARWPGVLGWFSIVLGALGILKNACGAVSNLGFGGRAFMGFGQSPEQQQAVERVMAGMEGLIIGLGVMGVISMVVSVVLLVGGVQLLRRKSAGVPVHRAWAAARIVLGLIECVLVYFFQSAVMKASIESMPTRKGGPPPDQLASCMNLSMGCGILVTLAIVLAYPVTVLIVLARPWARDEVQRWKAAEAGTPSGLQF